MNGNGYLVHYGIKGQRHGERRYQNLDGSLTPLGRLHYGIGDAMKSKVKTGLMDASYKARKGLRAARYKAFDSSIKARSALTDAKSSLSEARRKAEKSTYGIRRKVEEGAYKIGSRLGTQRAEAERLQRYVSGLKWERAAKASIENLKRQREYAIRVDAARQWLRTSPSARSLAARASDLRFSLRTGIDGISTKPGSLNGKSYNFYKSSNRYESPAATLAEKYAKTTNAWRDESMAARRSAERWWKIARGR